jgi:hypothetical protein
VSYALGDPVTLDMLVAAMKHDEPERYRIIPKRVGDHLRFVVWDRWPGRLLTTTQLKVLSRHIIPGPATAAPHGIYRSLVIRRLLATHRLGYVITAEGKDLFAEQMHPTSPTAPMSFQDAEALCNKLNTRDQRHHSQAKGIYENAARSR